MSEAGSKQPTDAYGRKTSDELVVLLREKDAQISKLLHELEAMLKLLFKLEADAKDHSVEARQKWCDDLVRPLLAQIKDWLDAKAMVVLPKSPMGEAIKHARKHWVEFTNFLRDGRIPTSPTTLPSELCARSPSAGRTGCSSGTRTLACRPACS